MTATLAPLRPDPDPAILRLARALARQAARRDHARDMAAARASDEPRRADQALAEPKAKHGQGSDLRQV